MNKLEALKKVIQEANQDIKILVCTDPKDNIVAYSREFHLTDILLAIGDRGLCSMMIHKAENYGLVTFIWQSGIPAQWNLLDDSLDHQSSVIIENFHKLLVEKDDEI
ncbi:MAG: hypothetical protein AB9866_18840 [Syntrophobacteraceae bacterium]